MRLIATCQKYHVSFTRVLYEIIKQVPWRFYLSWLAEIIPITLTYLLTYLLYRRITRQKLFVWLSVCEYVSMRVAQLVSAWGSLTFPIRENFLWSFCPDIPPPENPPEISPRTFHDGKKIPHTIYVRSVVVCWWLWERARLLTMRRGCRLGDEQSYCRCSKFEVSKRSKFEVAEPIHCRIIGFCCWYMTLHCDLWHLTLNICIVSPVTW